MISLEDGHTLFLYRYQRVMADNLYIMLNLTTQCHDRPCLPPRNTEKIIIIYVMLAIKHSI